MATSLLALFGEWPEKSLQIVDGNHFIMAKLFFVIDSKNAMVIESNTDLQIQVSLKGSGFIKIRLIQVNVNYVKYPPEDVKGDPVDILGYKQSDQEATIGIRPANKERTP
ncbi:MAG: hypothetical protein EZS28_044673, partial [Streblomastix strix]